MLKARAFLFALLLVSPLIASAQSEKFEVVKVADRVYAAIRKDPPGFAVESNSVFIMRDDGVVVVDAQSNVASTKAVARGALFSVYVVGPAVASAFHDATEKR